MSKHRAPSKAWYRRPVALGAGLVLAVGLTGAAVAADEPDTWAERLGQQGATIDAQIGGLEDALAQVTADRDALLLANQGLTTERDGLASQVATLTAERDALQAQLDELTATPSPSASPSPSPSTSTSTPPATMPAGSSLYRESGETHQEAYDRRCTNWGVCPEIVRYFYESLPSGSWPNFGDSTEVVSFKVPSMGGFASGANDSQVSGWLADVPKDGTTHYVALWHEPEDDIATGRFTAAEFRAGVAHLQQLAAEFDGTGKRIRVGVVLMGYTVQASSGRNVENYLVPGLDFYGWDIYTSPTDTADTRTKYALASTKCDADGVARCFLTETGPRVEGGTPSQSTKAAWVTQSAQHARTLGFDGWMYFDSTVGGDFRLREQVAFDAIAAEIRK